MVSNSWIRIPVSPRVTSVVVDDGPDVADDWIAERAGPGDIVITADIPLADRALKAGAQAIHPTGRVFTTDSIADANLRAEGIDPARIKFVGNLMIDTLLKHQKRG